MRKIVRGLVVATSLTLAPVSAAAFSTAPAQASESVVTAVAAPVAAEPTVATKAKARRYISVRDLAGPNARLRIRVRPEFGNKPLIIQKRVNGKFRTIGKPRTNRSGVVVRLFDGSFRGIRYRLIAVGGQKYETAAVSFTVTRRRV